MIRLGRHPVLVRLVMMRIRDRYSLQHDSSLLQALRTCVVRVNIHRRILEQDRTGHTYPLCIATICLKSSGKPSNLPPASAISSAVAGGCKRSCHFSTGPLSCQSSSSNSSNAAMAYRLSSSCQPTSASGIGGGWLSVLPGRTSLEGDFENCFPL